MLKLVVLLTIGCFLTACAGVTSGCSKSLCGCPKDYTKTVTIRLSSADSAPVAHAYLICLNTGETLGTTNKAGLIHLRVPGSMSVGCGFSADCEVAYFRTTERGFERPFWFSRVLRETNNDAADQRIEIVGDGG